MTSFIEHSDDWHYQPPVPPRLYYGWWISNDDSEPMDGPYSTRELAEEVLAEAWWDQDDTEPEQFEDDFNLDFVELVP